MNDEGPQKPNVKDTCLLWSNMFTDKALTTDKQPVDQFSQPSRDFHRTFTEGREKPMKWRLLYIREPLKTDGFAM